MLSRFPVLVTFLAQIISARVRDDGCERRCTLVYQPVCGSDGITYSNECDLEVKACQKAKHGITLTLASHGMCPPAGQRPVPGTPAIPGVPAIEAVVAEEEYDDDDYDNDECPARCTLQWDIKCGTDGKNYPNECELRRQACTDGPSDLKVAYDGKCSLFPLSASIPELPSLDEQGCPECNKVFLPVCGTDGVTYNNKCKLDEAACKVGDYNLIRFFKNGPCNDGDVVQTQQQNKNGDIVIAKQHNKGWQTTGFYYLYYPIFLY